MSLKIEQRLDDFFFTECAPRIYTTGAQLVPMKIGKGKKVRYIWIVDEFDNDTYADGELCFPNVYTNRIENLLDKT